MTPAEYDAWYDTPRGRWIGETEYALVRRTLSSRVGETVLDVGCGTGWFTRHLAADGLTVTGLDPNADALAFARVHSDPKIRWVDGDARRLPFPDASFDCVVSIAALCFIPDEQEAIAEIVRVARRRFAIGWLNQASVLYRQKGRGGGSGAYHGARWYTAEEVRQFFVGLPVTGLKVPSAVFLPSNGLGARMAEQLLPNRLTLGALLISAGQKVRSPAAGGMGFATASSPAQSPARAPLR
jgi:SAM-dependent methyltransferase